MRLSARALSRKRQDIDDNHAGWGENVAAGQRTPAEALATWMNSDGHRANILSASYTEIGFGVVASENGTRYWTQVFGIPR